MVSSKMWNAEHSHSALPAVFKPVIHSLST